GVSMGPESSAMLTYRVIFASTRGTLMELGIGPIVTAGLIIQLLAGARMIEVDFSNPEDRALFTAASKVFSLAMIMLQSAIYIISGAFGTVTFGISILIFLQLLASGIIIMLLDELLQKGWGIGSGISLFIVAGIAQRIWWDSLSFIPVGDGKRLGAIFAFFESIILGEPIWNWFHRSGGFPDMIGLLTTITVFAVVIYVEGMRVELPVSHSTFRGYRGKMPIKLLYVSNIPVIFAYALFANIQLGSQLIWQRWNRDNSNFWLGLLGTYNRSERGPIPTGGLVYYVTSPGGIEAISTDPLRVIVYILIVVSVCILFSKLWIEVGGMGPEKVAEQLIQSGMQVPGFRRSKGPIESLLRRYIPTITILGGLIVGLISSVSELFGVFGSGMGALLCVSILYQFYQVIIQEQIEDIYPFLRGALR
ncbi:preprotein translocase subunit SecY, partial [Candidatus Bathyarchaeota archaeon]|nr:preprotein translocase subunit SecY [Candidatus Bathyarchaeota archaeon]